MIPPSEHPDGLMASSPVRRAGSHLLRRQWPVVAGELRQAIGDFVIIALVFDEHVLGHSKTTRLIERSSEYPSVVFGRPLPKQERPTGRTEAAFGLGRGAIPGDVGRAVDLDVAGLGAGAGVTMAGLLAALRTVAFGHLAIYAARAVAHPSAVTPTGCLLENVAHGRSLLLIASAHSPYHPDAKVQEHLDLLTAERTVTLAGGLTAHCPGYLSRAGRR